MARDAARIAATYFDAWKVNDFDTMRSLVDSLRKSGERAALR